MPNTTAHPSIPANAAVLGKRHPLLAGVRRALAEGTLTPEGLLPVEGIKSILEAQASGLAIPAIFLRRGTTAPNLPDGARVYVLEESAFKQIQDTRTSPGVAALVRMPAFTLADLLDRRAGGPIVVLDRLQDPGNAGTILRVAESFAAAGCIGLAGTVGVYTPKVVRATAGSIFRLPHVWGADFQTLRDALRQTGVAVVGTSPHAAAAISDWDWRKPAAILIGNEGAGLTPQETAACDAVLRIPHSPSVESLNSAVAAAIILYEAYRQRGLS